MDYYPKPKPTDRRVTVHRGGVEWECVIGWSGRYIPATRLDPPDYPEPYVAFAWRDGVALCDPMDVPEDVAEEAVCIDSEYESEEPDPPEDDEEHSSRDSL